jgi:hypothetical protein
MAKDYDKERVLSDWRTGGYTIRELAARHSIGRATVGAIVKGIDKENRTIVDNKITANQAVRELSDKDGQAVREVITRIEEKRIKAEKLDDYLDNAAGLAAKKGVEILNNPNLSMIEIEQFSKAQNNIRVGIGTQQKFAGTVINNTNAQKSDNTLIIERLKQQ